MIGSTKALGVAAILYAIAFNIPYSILASTFEYPGVLRRPAGEILSLFAQGGAPLILTWYGFMIAALLFAPVAIALSLRAEWLKTQPALAVGAAIAGSLAGLSQAIGLSRWVFVVPHLAQSYVGPSASDAARTGIESTFALLNLYGGVAIGENIGQLLTVLFVLLLALLQLTNNTRIVAAIGLLTAFAILIGTGEGLALSLGQSGEVFSLFTTAGFLLLTLWLIATGVSLLRKPSR